MDNGRLVRRFDGHTGGVMSAVWSADGAYAASGGQDGTLIVWNSASGELLRQIAAHDGVIHHVAFTENGDGVWSAAEDGKIHLWATSLDDTALKAWIIAHRHIQPLTCLQKAQYGLNDLCADDS